MGIRERTEAGLVSRNAVNGEREWKKAEEMTSSEGKKNMYPLRLYAVNTSHKSCCIFSTENSSLTSDSCLSKEQYTYCLYLELKQ